MKDKSYLSPCFKWSETNKSEGVIMTPRQTFEYNLLALIDSYHMTNDDEDFILICAKEKSGDDYKFNMACIPIEREENDLISVAMSDFKKVPTVLVNADYGIIQIVKKVIKNLVFS